MNPRTKLWLDISVGVTLLSVLAFFLFFYKARLTVVPTPATAQVLINGQAISPSVATKLSPGAYEITVRAKGHLPETATVELGVSQILTLPIKLRAIPAPTTTQEDVRYPVFTPDESSILFLGNGGKQFFLTETELGNDNKVKTRAITDARFTDVANVVWSSDRSLVVYQTTAGKTKLFDFKRYDLLHQEDRELEDHQKSIVWHPTQRQTVSYLAAPGGERTLLKKDLLTNATERLIDLRPYELMSPELVWSPDGQTIAIIEQRLYLYDVATHRLTQVPEVDGATHGSFSPDSSKLAYETANGISLIALPNLTLSQLNLRTTIAKITWLTDGDFLIASVPTDRGVDQLFKITPTGDGRRSYAFDHTVAVTPENLLLDKQNTYLWFTSQNGLYRLLLEETKTVN